eukprot:11461933-Alexandrium_andersonii.AAC.1
MLAGMRARVRACVRACVCKVPGMRAAGGHPYGAHSHWCTGCASGPQRCQFGCPAGPMALHVHHR